MAGLDTGTPVVVTTTAFEANEISAGEDGCTMSWFPVGKHVVVWLDVVITAGAVTASGTVWIAEVGGEGGGDGVGGFGGVRNGAAGTGGAGGAGGASWGTQVQHALTVTEPPQVFGVHGEKPLMS
jgi:hypothetical protein